MTASIAQLIAELARAQREIEMELQEISSFESQTENNIALVNSTLRGSTRSHDARMAAALSHAQDSLRTARDSLTAALEALQRVQTI